MKPPPLKNDCFAMPPGVDWLPVDDALAHLKARLSSVTPMVSVPVEDALGLFLADAVRAVRANPPSANSAVDGYGFAGGADHDGTQILPLTPGRAAAGAPFTGAVPPGHAVRILTGAILPEGVDTVVLEEDISAEPDRIAYRGPLKRGANTRAAGEDVAAGAILFQAGRRVQPQDIALMKAVGVAEVTCHQRLRVGVVSTGDELVQSGPAAPHQIYDANRPMLLSLLAQWGYEAVDLGAVADDRAALGAALDAGAQTCDAILTSGGASAGDEDHVSALLRETGSLGLWRIAVKPGRPLALGLWDGVPVFGLPGNPIAAFVCTLIFAEPAFRCLAGGAWRVIPGVMVPASFTKRKKAGRREFLRARLTPEGQAETFKSEGSGRISGLSWADGLVELSDEAQEIAPGTPVRFLQFSTFGSD